jgi:phage terminase large subunit GpA-like protein
MTTPMAMTRFDTLERLVAEVAASVRPPERLTVSQAAEKYRYLNNPGAYVGPWKNDMTPYLVEPMDELTSREFTGWVFAGPAQTGKTDMAINYLAYSVKCDPADMMIVQTTATTARDFSMRRIDRLHRHSPEIGKMLVPSKQGDNVYDKHYTSGMLLTLSWPTINELSGKPIPRLWLTDYDRMEQDVDGEGSPFDLAKKRATTFRSFGMCAAESSPGFPVLDPKWRPSTPHEAPPTSGILGLYNKGDRRRWFWRCVSCGTPFEPDFELLNYPDSEDLMEAAEMATLRCPHCNIDYPHDPDFGMPGKHEMNRNGRWIKEGMVWRPDGSIDGKPIRSTTASFWLKGVAAAFSDWKTLVFNYLSAMREYQQTGNEESLKTTINTDQGKPYIPKSLETGRSPQELESRAKDYGMRVVPYLARFLVACIDVQKNRFVVQVHAICENHDINVIDRFEIKKSKRYDSDRERKWVNPGAYFEDWKLLVEEVLLKTYPLADNSGRHMAIHLTVCDSGGREGVAANAYDFVRWLRRPEHRSEGSAADEGTYQWEQGLASRFLLLRGDSKPGVPRVRIEYPDSQRKDKNAGARGEIPVMFINSNAVKDQLNHALDRTDPGGRINFPNWLEPSFFTELTVEIKDPKKGWINPRAYRNESWDLLAYCIAACLSQKVGIERIRFDDPPSWAERWDQNSLVFSPEVDKGKPFDAKPKSGYDMAKLAAELG